MFDVVVGNPPYGKNSNLAVEFLNLGSRLSTDVYFVLPRSFRKASIVNRITPTLHLVTDTHVEDSVFPGSIITCWQHWTVKQERRKPIPTTYSHPDFDFVSKAEGQVALGRVGGPSGRVYTDFDIRSENSHYFIKENVPGVIDRLKSLESELKTKANQTVACPSLSRDDLVKVYQSSLDNK